MIKYIALLGFLISFSSCDVLQEMMEANTQQGPQQQQQQESQPQSGSSGSKLGDKKTESAKDKTTNDNEELAKELNLSTRQADDLSTITKKYNTDLSTARKNANGDSAKMNTQMRSLRKNYNASIRKILSETQVRKYEDYLKKKALSNDKGKMQGK